MKEIIIQPQLKQCVADNLLLFFLGILCLLFTGYDNTIISLSSLCFFLIISVLILFKFLNLKVTKWIITQEQIIYIRGVFSRKKDYIELYRVNDFQEQQSFIQQIMGIKSLTILSSDKSHPELYLVGVYSNTNLIEIIRYRVEINKQNKRVYEMSNR